jgi:hypothetical protein
VCLISVLLRQRLLCFGIYSRFFISSVLSRFAVCEALAEQMMVVGGKLAGAQPHWSALASPAPELPWPVVQSLLQQQRALTHVQTPIQNGIMNASPGSRDALPHQYLKVQKHYSPSESSLGNTGRSSGTRVFLSTLPKTKSQVSISRLQLGMDLSAHFFFQAEAREAAAMRPLSRTEHDSRPLAPAIAPGSGFKRSATARPVVGLKEPQPLFV